MQRSSCSVSKLFFVSIIMIAFGAGYLFLVPLVLGGVYAEGRVRSLEGLTVAQLEAARPGTEVLIEGLVSNENETVSERMVAYIRRTSYTIGNDLKWRDQDTISPPLLIDVADGKVRLEGGYRIIDPGYSRVPNNNSGVSFSGLTRGTKIIALGEVTPDGTVAAEFVAGGTKSSYVWKRMGERWSVYGGGLCSLVCGIVLFLAAIVGWRASRRRPEIVPPPPGFEG